MNGDNLVEPIGITLSRDELLFVLDALQAAYLPGLDTDPLGELTPEQQTWTNIVAGRALQARELAQVHEGTWTIHNTLLTAVGVCSYAQSTIFVYHWPSTIDLPVRTFCHLRGEKAVVHTRPADVLHHFQLVSTPELIAEIVRSCGCENISEASQMRLTLSSSQFAEVRSLAIGGNISGAVSTLVASGVPQDVANAFIETLAGAPHVSILQMVKQQGNGVDKYDCTVIQNHKSSWLIQVGQNDHDRLVIQTISLKDFQLLLETWL
jgi:hypothetical protein